MKNYKLFSIALLAVLIVLAVVGVSLSQATSVQMTSADVFTHPSQGDVRQVEGAQASLFTTTEGATMHFRTNGLEAGHIYTAWWIVVNNPDACSASPCTGKDILGNSDLVQADVTQADSILVGEAGEMEFAGFLAAGSIDADDAWFGNGFANPLSAEIHVTINDHGPLIPGMASTMLNTYRGGCQDEGLPGAFPPTAIGDGELGPNTCRLVQFAIFRQGAE
jgi:hypothetical protein